MYLHTPSLFSSFLGLAHVIEQKRRGSPRITGPSYSYSCRQHSSNRRLNSRRKDTFQVSLLYLRLTRLLLPPRYCSIERSINTEQLYTNLRTSTTLHLSPLNIITYQNEVFLPRNIRPTCSSCIYLSFHSKLLPENSHHISYQTVHGPK